MKSRTIMSKYVWVLLNWCLPCTDQKSSHATSCGKPQINLHRGLARNSTHSRCFYLLYWLFSAFQHELENAIAYAFSHHSNLRSLGLCHRVTLDKAAVTLWQRHRREASQRQSKDDVMGRGATTALPPPHPLALIAKQWLIPGMGMLKASPDFAQAWGSRERDLNVLSWLQSSQRSCDRNSQRASEKQLYKASSPKPLQFVKADAERGSLGVSLCSPMARVARSHFDTTGPSLVLWANAENFQAWLSGVFVFKVYFQVRTVGGVQGDRARNRWEEEVIMASIPALPFLLFSIVSLLLWRAFQANTAFAFAYAFSLIFSMFGSRHSLLLYPTYTHTSTQSLKYPHFQAEHEAHSSSISIFFHSSPPPYFSPFYVLPPSLSPS